MANTSFKNKLFLIDEKVSISNNDVIVKSVENTKTNEIMEDDNKKRMKSATDDVSSLQTKDEFANNININNINDRIILEKRVAVDIVINSKLECGYVKDLHVKGDGKLFGKIKSNHIDDDVVFSVNDFTKMSESNALKLDDWVEFSFIIKMNK